MITGMSDSGNSQENEGKTQAGETAGGRAEAIPDGASEAAAPEAGKGLPAFDPAAETSYSLPEIKRSSARGGAVTMLAQGAGVVIQLTSTVVLARLLRPAEYGVIAMVAAVTAFAGLFRDLGLSASTIQRKEINDKQVSTLYWVNVAVGALLTLATAGAAPLVAWFYDRPELAPVTVALSFGFLIGSFGTQPGALLNRNMRFGRLAVANLAGAFLSVLLSIGLAVGGMSYWSLVIGSLGGAVLTSLLLNFLSGWWPGLPLRGTGLRAVLRYGANITAFDFANYFHRNLDNVLIGRFWGADVLGLYTRAYQLLMFPIQNLRNPIMAVAFPAMSRLQDQPEHFRVYYRQVTALVAFLSMPLTAFLMVSSHLVIRVLLGPQWLGAVPIFSVLAIVAFIQPSYSLIGVVMLSSGNSRQYLRVGLFNTALYTLGFVIGVRFGAVGLAIGYAIATYLVIVPSLSMSFAGTSVRPSDFWRAVALPGSASLLAGAVLFFTSPMWKQVPPTLGLAMAAALFAVIYLAAFLVLPGGKSLFKTHTGVLRYLRKERSVENPDSR
jgi:PST family polysaccharide transporter